MFQYAAVVASCLNLFSIVPQCMHMRKYGVGENNSKPLICLGILISMLFLVSANSRLHLFTSTSAVMFQIFILSKVFENDRQMAEAKSKT